MPKPRKIVKLIPFGNIRPGLLCEKWFCKTPAIWRVNGKALCETHKQRATK